MVPKFKSKTHIHMQTSNIVGPNMHSYAARTTCRFSTCFVRMGTPNKFKSYPVPASHTYLLRLLMSVYRFRANINFQNLNFGFSILVNEVTFLKNKLYMNTNFFNIYPNL